MTVQLFENLTNLNKGKHRIIFLKSISALDKIFEDCWILINSRFCSCWDKIDYRMLNKLIRWTNTFLAAGLNLFFKLLLMHDQLTTLAKYFPYLQTIFLLLQTSWWSSFLVFLLISSGSCCYELCFQLCLEETKTQTITKKPYNLQLAKHHIA